MTFYSNVERLFGRAIETKRTFLQFERDEPVIRRNKSSPALFLAVGRSTKVKTQMNDDEVLAADRERLDGDAHGRR